METIFIILIIISMFVFAGGAMVGMFLMAFILFEGVNQQTKKKAIIGAVTFVVSISLLVITISSGYNADKENCEAIGGELVKIDKGYSWSAATKTMRKDYDYICVKESD
jgi:hypothetical protein